MKKLYIFNETCPGANYGIGTYIRQLTLALEKTDVQVHVIHLLSAKKQFEIETTGPVTHFYFPYIPLVGLTPEDVNTDYIKSCLYVLLSFTKDNPEQFFLFNHYIPSECLQFMKTRWPQTTYIYAAHFFDPQIIPEPDQIAFLGEVDRIICLSGDTLHSMIKNLQINPAKLELIYNGKKDDSKPITQMQRNAIRRSLYVRPEEIVLLFVGRIDMFKGIGHVLTTFEQLVEWNENCHLFIIGDGAWEEYAPYCKRTWGRISFTGKLNEDQLIQFYRIADIGLILSYHEQCSFVGIEMMMHGLPAIVSSAPGLNEMFTEGIDTIRKVTVSPEVQKKKTECEAICNAVKMALSDPAYLKKTGRNAYKTYCRNYHLSIFKEKYLKLFNSNPQKE